ncbi:hypothetical protein QUB26_29650, partial [Microcoleus sp. B4-C1]
SYSGGRKILALIILLTIYKTGMLPFSFSNNEKQKFSEEVSSLIQNESFLSDFSNQIGEPLEEESEDDFVKRGSNRLRKMLYDRFGIKG